MPTVQIALLMRHLADAETPVAVAQLYQFTDLSGDSLAQFRHAWPNIPVKRRRQVLGFLVEIATSSFEVDLEAVFRACIKDTDPEVRRRSIEGLWESKDANLITPLLDVAQNDPAIPVRAAAASALGHYVFLGEMGRLTPQHQGAIEEVLWTLLHSPKEDIEVQRRAVEALACSSREEVPSIIENAYQHQDRRMRVSAVFAMGRSLDTQWVPPVLDELHSRDPELRFEAARACGELELTAAIPRLAELLNDPDREVQEASIWALGQVGSQKARQILEANYEVTDQEDKVLREAFEEALSEVALVAGAIQFSFYEYDADAEPETGSWAKDWLNGVIQDELDNEVDTMRLDDPNG